jgi:hypothetical protein
MARFVMIAIPDNADAQAFVDAINRGDVIIGFNKDEGILNREDTYTYGPLKGEAVAMWADPTKLCECHPPWQLPNHKEPGSGLQCTTARSVNYGWQVCTKCSKPHHFQFQHPRNLLVPGETPSNRTYCLGFRADRSAKDATETP